ncbi:MAG TPA: hypothetical protein PKC69_08065 [Chitinophagaceae bacterium]|nr:hypothetical protein [Chitinophagaceae bacterium]
MFLKQVYRYSKPMFLLMVLFALFQLFCFYKQGMVFAPWFNYGMYSGRVKIQPEYDVYALPGKYNGTTRWLLPQKDDRVLLALDWYNGQEANNLFFQKNVMGVCSKFRLKPDAAKFTIHVPEATFRRWYYPYASAWVVLPDSSLYDFKPRKAAWDGYRLQLKSTGTP